MANALNVEEAAKAFKFSAFCESLDSIRQIPKKVGNSKFFKQRAVRSVCAKWKALFAEEVTPNYFPLVRLLANSYDTRKYSMKTKRLIMKVCKALLLPDAIKQSLLSLSNRDESGAVQKLSVEIASRHTAVKKDLTLFDLNASLDRVIEPELSETELHELLKGCTSGREVFWILHILLRKVEKALGVSPSIIVNCIHPHAGQMRQAGTSLERICDLAAENKLRDESSLLFKAFEPMLLARVKQSEGVNVYDKLVQWCGSPFYMQVKFDGEHFLLHRKDGEYRFFSRNQLDHTERVGRFLSSRMDSCFAPSVENCVFDGELLLWDVFENKHVGKGRQASDGRVYDVKHLREDGACIPCMAVFDLLYLNGRSLVDIPLNQRLEILRTVFQKQDKSAIFIGDFEVVSSREGFAKFFEAAMHAHEEGVVVKKMDSLYKIGVRSIANGCFKVKPFHLGTETLDVAVVGVDRAGDGHIQSYTVAVLRDKKYSIIGKVGAGLDYSAREHLRRQLEKDHGLLKGDKVPDWIHYDYSNTDLATDYVHKSNLQVLELKAKGIANNRLYSPVIKFYRDDKAVKDIDTYETFQEFDETLRAQSITAAESATPSGRKRLSVVPEVMGEYKVVRNTAVEKVGTEFKGLQFCILRGTGEYTIQNLKEIVESFGGDCSANPTKKTQYVITGEPRHLKTKSIIKANKYNVIDAHWLIDCKNASSVLPLKRKYILHTVDDVLLAKLRVVPEVDDDNDAAERKNNLPVESFSEEPIIKRRKVEARSENEEWSVDWIKSKLDSFFKREVTEAPKKKSLKMQLLQEDIFHRFDGEVFYLHESLYGTVKKYLKVLVKIHGGKVTESVQSASLIVANTSSVEAMQKELVKNVRLVDIRWIEKKIGI